MMSVLEQGAAFSDQALRDCSGGTQLRQSGRENNLFSFSRRKSQVAGPVWGPGRVGLFSYSELLNKVDSKDITGKDFLDLMCVVSMFW